MPANVLLIVLDTARADVFEPYGAPVGASPAIANLASRGTAVPKAYAAASWTVPSHASLLTGKLSRSLRLGQIPGGDRHICKPRLMAARDRYLPAVLADRGFDVRGVSANPWISESSGFAEGFASFDQVATSRRGRMYDPSTKQRIKWALEAFVAKGDDGARAAEQVLYRWIDDGPTAPFFWFVNLLECHSPYLPPKPHNRLNAYQRLLAAEDARNYLTFHDVIKTCLGIVEIPPTALARMRKLYEDSIRLMDSWLERVLTALDAKGILDDTQVIITSDHGENLGEQNLIGHGLSLDERLIRVPFVTAGPLDLAMSDILSLVELPSVLADGLGLESHPWEADERNDGVVVAQFDGFGGEDMPPIDEAESWGLTDEARGKLLFDLTAATDGRWKLVRHGDRERFFDLSADPLETHSVAVSDVAEAARLRAAVDAAEYRATAVLPAAAGPQPEMDADEAAALEEQMRLLGYL